VGYAENEQEASVIAMSETTPSSVFLYTLPFSHFEGYAFQHRCGPVLARCCVVFVLRFDDDDVMDVRLRIPGWIGAPDCPKSEWS